jgi:predicted phage terminase large subunit-like protein
MPAPYELICCARLDFWCFVELVFHVLHPGNQLVFAEYLEVLAWLLMSTANRKKRRIIVNMPPRHLKSMMVSVLYVAWRLGCDPTAKFICASYGDDLAHHLSELTRRLMLSSIYRRIFPGTRLDKKAVDYIRTTEGGYRYATAVGSDITGFGADEIILDDLLQPDKAASESAKERVRSWVQSSVMTRFNDPNNGVLIVVEHRLAPDDLSATLEVTGLYFTLKLPLIAEEPEHFVHQGRTVMRRKPGDVLNPARMNEEQAAELQKTLARHIYLSQYQQRPEAGGSGMLQANKIPRYNLACPPEFDFKIHSWDIGATISGNASVCTKWGVRRDPDGRWVAYLVDVLRLKVELPDVEAAIKAQDKIDKPALIILDERGVGLGLYQRLWRAGYEHVTGSTATKQAMETQDSKGVHPSLSKVERFGQAVLVISDGRIFIPAQAPWLEIFLYEVAAFPNIAEKDQVDSMTQFVANFERAIKLALQNISRGR